MSFSLIFSNPFPDCPDIQRPWDDNEEIDEDDVE